MYLQCQGGPRAKALIDSGNLFGDAISEEFFKSLPVEFQEVEPSSIRTVHTAKKSQGIEVVGKLRKPLYFTFQGHSTRFSIRPTVLKGLSMPINLGYSFMARSGLVLRPHQGEVLIQGTAVPLPLLKDISGPAVAAVHVARDVIVPANQIFTIPGKLSALQAAGSEVSGLLEIGRAHV